MTRAGLIEAVKTLRPGMESGETRPTYIELAALATLCAEQGLESEVQRVLGWLSRARDVRMHRFDAACPFILCFDTMPHAHPVCPQCDTVNLGNPDCDYCRERRTAYNDICTISRRAPVVVA